MDISKYSSKKTANVTHTVKFLSPEDGFPLEEDGKPMFAVVVSKNSKVYEKALSRVVNAARKAEKFGADDTFSVSKEKQKTANLLAACTRQLSYFDGQWQEISVSDDDSDEALAQKHSKIREAYLEYDWMADAVDKGIGNDGNFLGKSVENSHSTSSNELG